MKDLGHILANVACSFLTFTFFPVKLKALVLVGVAYCTWSDQSGLLRRNLYCSEWATLSMVKQFFTLLRTLEHSLFCS